MNESSKFVIFFKLLLGLYIISTSFFAIYFNYVFAVQHGFLSWLFWGDLISSLKAIVWPIFIF